ncbi:DUF2971 domain-containing protein [Sunxiuqinia indica]|uniref:DUF2971 domain-containing protein n=1 Tax=Sunxiuqinia indica TaxID=2692584 RepID=UPI00135B3EDC|nr:DUF2971 domain-containing protein [Sunxiuqinia indica]
MKEYLYHYTSLATCIEYILPNRELKFNKIKESNDPPEYIRNLSDFNFKKGSKEFRKGFQNTEFVSFCQGLKNDPEKFGFLNYPMWAHYGDGHKGVCLVFDKEKLVTELIDQHDDCKSGDYIRYCPAMPNVKDTGESIFERINNSDIDLFFTKTDGWSYENEFRLIVPPRKKDAKKSNRFLNIEESLKGIIIGYKVNVVYNDLFLTLGAAFQGVRLFKLSLSNGQFKVEEPNEFFSEGCNLDQINFEPEVFNYSISKSKKNPNL